MIEQIEGKIIRKSPTYCILDCHGIGFGLHISVNTSQKLEQQGSHASILTYLHVREDLLQLYGFCDEDERMIFRQLISISGIGPRLAIGILSGITATELTQAISTGNYQILTHIPGVGKKTAQRIILELKEKVKISEDISTAIDIAGLSRENQNKVNEALIALISLGYRQTEAKRSIEKVLLNSADGISLEDLIKLTLKEM